MHVYLAPGPGFEPGLEDSKSSVLPLNDPGTRLFRISDYLWIGRGCKAYVMYLLTLNRSGSKVRLVLGFQSTLILCWDVRHLTRVGCTMCSVG